MLNDWSNLTFYPLGDSAIVLHFGDEIAPTIQQQISACAAYLDQNAFTGMREYVPGYTTLTVFYNAWLTSKNGTHDPYDQALQHLQTMLLRIKVDTAPNSKLWEVPVLYGEEFGPDLNFVASHNYLSPEEVISIHTAADYLIYMIGFAPGFPYLGGMSEKIAVPRKTTPRSAVLAGSVGIAGNQTGIYPIPTPGGWQIIGRTPLSLFNPHRDPPVFMRAGDVVRFVPISPAEFADQQAPAI